MSRLDNESWYSFPLGSVAAKKAAEEAEERKKIIKEQLEEEAKAAEKSTPFDWSGNHYRNR